MSLRLGDIAANFQQASSTGEIDFYQFLGDSWGVLFSHPADYTPVCTTELGFTAKLKDEFEKPYFQTLSRFIKDEILAGQTIYPHPKNIFSALDNTPFENVKVVILGQDPYHGPGQAHGLSFSVME